MKSSKEILSELQEIAPVLANPAMARIPYAVPAGYFENFMSLLMERLRFESETFEQSAGDEIQSLSPLLAGLKKKNPYQAPAGYFESIKIPVSEQAIVKPIGPLTQGKTVPAPVRHISFPIRIIRYAAAACIVALLGLTVFNITQNSFADPIKGLTTVSEQDMANYLEESDVHETESVNTPSTDNVSLDFSDSEIHELFSGVTDRELEQYLPSLPIENQTVN